MAKQFSLFTKGKSGGIDLSNHFEKWGWISFLTYVTEKGLFDINGNGKNKLENTKADYLKLVNYQDAVKEFFTKNKDKIAEMGGEEFIKAHKSQLDQFQAAAISLMKEQVEHKKPIVSKLLETTLNKNIKNVGSFIGEKGYQDVDKALDAVLQSTKQSLITTPTIPGLDPAAAALAAKAGAELSVATSSSVQRRGGVDRTIMQRPTLKRSASGSPTPADIPPP